MDERFVTGIVTVLIAVTGVAILAVLVSRQSDTSSVLSAGASSFGQMLCRATSPIHGGSCGGNLATIPTVTRRPAERVESTITYE